MAEVELGYCECGCGARTTIAPQTDPVKGWVNGRPLRFIRGHANRKQNRDPKLYARSAVEHAVSSGAIRKPSTCEACGAENVRRIQAHHADYAKPLEVEWLCAKCHTARHPRPAGYNSKLTPEAVLEIRASDESARVLGEQYGVSRSAIQAVRSGQNWSHLKAAA